MTIIYRYIAWGAVMLALIAAAGVRGYVFGTDTQRDKDTAANAAAQKKVMDKYLATAQAGAAIETGYLTANAKANSYLQQLQQQEYQNAHPTVVPAPTLSTAYVVPVLTQRSVCLWNRAWSGDDVPSGSTAAGPDAATECPVGDAPSPFTVTDALASNLDEAAACTANTRQLRALIEYENTRINTH